MIVSLLALCAAAAALTVQSLLLRRVLRAAAMPEQATEKAFKSPMDEGFDNIMRYAADGRNGPAPERWEE